MREIQFRSFYFNFKQQEAKVLRIQDGRPIFHIETQQQDNSEDNEEVEEHQRCVKDLRIQWYYFRATLQLSECAY